MTLFKKEQEEIKEPIREFWPDNELWEFDKELEPYRVDAVDKNGNPFKCLFMGGRIKYFRDQGIARVKGEITDDMKTRSDLPYWAIYRNKLREFAEFDNKYECLQDLKYRIEFGKKKELESYKNAFL